MTLENRVHDPIILGDDQPFLKGRGDSRYIRKVLFCLCWCSLRRLGLHWLPVPHLPADTGPAFV